MPAPKPATVAAYIAAAPKETQGMLRELRAILQSVVPDAEESLKWGNPVFERERILFAYAAFKTHLNFMPTPAVVEAFRKELKGYTVGKGSIRFPYGEPLPEGLIRKMAALRAKRLLEDDARWM